MNPNQTQGTYSFAPIQASPTTPQVQPTQNVQTPTNTQPQSNTSLDQDALNLAKSIRQTESQGNFQARGKSGEYGAYQYMPATWSAWSKQYLGQDIPLQQATPAQQNEVAYKRILDRKNAGLKMGQIASEWNSGHPDWEGRVGVHTNPDGTQVPYDVPSYVNKVANTYQQIKQQSQPQTGNGVAKPMEVDQEAGKNNYGAPFAYTNTAPEYKGGFVQSIKDIGSGIASDPIGVAEGGLIGGAKAIGNFPNSLLNIGKGIAQIFLHPIDTATGLGNVAIGSGEALGRKILENTKYKELVDRLPPDKQENFFNNFIAGMKDKYWGLDNLTRYAVDNPAQFGSDVVMALQASAKVADVVKNAYTGLSNAKNLVSETGALRPVDGAHDILNGGKSVTQPGPGDILNNIVFKDRMIANGDINPSQVYSDVAGKVYQPQAAADIIGDAQKALTTAGHQDLASKFGEIMSNTEKITPDAIVGTIKNLIQTKGSTFGNALDQGISTVGSAPINMAKNLAKNVFSETAGVTTGLGTPTIKAGIKASLENGDTRAAFNEAKSGKYTPDQIVDEARSGLDTLYQNRSQIYQDQINKLAGDSKTFDISPIQNELQNQLSKFKINVGENGALDFSRSKFALDPAGQADISKLVDYVKGYGTQAGDRTAAGLDNLKQVVGGYYSPSSDYRAFTQGIKSSIWDPKENSGVLSQVQGYQKLSGDYADASNYIKDLQQTLSMGGKAGIETVFNKLTSAVKGNSQMRTEFVSELNDLTGGTLVPHLAGARFQGLLPVGTSGVLEKFGGVGGLGYAIGTGNWLPVIKTALPLLTIASPAVVGKFLSALGFTSAQINKVMTIINKGASSLPLLSQLNGTVNNQNYQQ